MMLFISFLYLYKQHLEFRLPSGPKAGSGPVPVLGRPVPIRFRYGKKIPVRFRYSGYRVPWSTTNGYTNISKVQRPKNLKAQKTPKVQMLTAQKTQRPKSLKGLKAQKAKGPKA